MTLLSRTTGYAFLIAFGVVMNILTIYYSKRIKDPHNTKSFLVANRKVNMLLGAFSIAASWTWAPALLISSQTAFQQGLPGVFWFTAPNILTLTLFAFLAVRIRNIAPYGYTLPEFIRSRFDAKTHIAYLFSFLSLQICALAVQILAGASTIHWFTGISFVNAAVLITIIFSSYSLISGMEASIITDFVQMTMVIIICALIVPWVLIKAGGLASITGGLGGYSGKFTNIFDPYVAYSFGIPVAIGLLAGPIGDQQHWQRAFAIKKGILMKTHFLSGLVFGVVPVLLAFLGFIAANHSLNTGWNLSNAQLVGPVTVSHLLPTSATMLFVLMILSGLASAGDSALCAAVSLGAIDIHKTYINPNASDREIVFVSRLTMVIIAILGLVIALLPNMKVLYLFLFYGTLRAATMLPTVLSLYWKSFSADACFLAVVLATLLGLPVFGYGSVMNNIHIQLLGSLLTVIIGFLLSVIVTQIRPDNFDYSRIATKGFGDFK